MMKPDALLYLTVKSSVQGQWFKAQVMGVEKTRAKQLNSPKNKPRREKNTCAKAAG